MLDCLICFDPIIINSDFNMFNDNFLITRQLDTCLIVNCSCLVYECKLQSHVPMCKLADNLFVSQPIFPFLQALFIL